MKEMENLGVGEIDALVGQMVSVVESTLRVARVMVPEYAKLHRQYYKSLVDEGFDPEQALRIMCAHALMPGGK